MAGGQGERFWPLTHPGFPKYLIKTDPRHSFLQKTFLRLSKVYGAANIYVVTTREHRPFILAELPRLKKDHLILEPCRNNTASAILLSSATIAKHHGQDTVVSFFPADHLMRDEAAFSKTIRKAIHTAQREDSLVTIGIRPSFPATGYGYIRSGSSVGSGVHRVARFVEKPSREKALRYLKDGGYYWNSGMFTWKASVLMGEMATHASDLSKHFRISDPAASYKKMPRISIDHALLEKTPNILLIPSAMDWNDIGSWDAYFDKSAKDLKGNFIEGSCAVNQMHDSLIVNHTQMPLAASHLKDVLIVSTPRGVLVTRRGYSESAALLSKEKTRQ